MFDAESWGCAEKILCVRLDALGDLLLTVPALRALKDSCPGRHITVLTSRAGAAVAPLVPEIDAVIEYDAPWAKGAPARAESRAEYALADRLRCERFHAAAIFTVASQSPLPAALLCYLSDIPLRLAQCRENPYHLLTHWVLEREPHDGLRHEVRRQLDLVAEVGATTANEKLSLRLPEAAKRYVRRQLARLGIEPRRPWVVIHPGASVPAHRYPPERLARAARLLMLEHGFQIVFAGIDGERELVERIQAALALPSVSLVGQLNLSEFAALLSLAPILITNNTGPVPVAAAVGTPVVDLYGLTPPQHTPWGVPHRVLTHDVPPSDYRSEGAEEHHQGLRLIPPDAVVQATCELYEETQSAPALLPMPRAVTGRLDMPQIAGS